MAIRRRKYANLSHLVIDGPDTHRALLPAWMADPYAATLPIVDVPRLSIDPLWALCRLIDSLRSLLSAANQLGGGDREAKPTDASTRSAVHQGERKPVKVYRSGIVRGNSKSAQTSYGRVRINPKVRTDRRRKGGKG
jgi:hypothetical protein